MLTASKAKPPATATDFIGFVHCEFNTDIKERTSQIWLYLLGFKYRKSGSLETYNDGHQREDVLKYLIIYCTAMLDIHEQCISYTAYYYAYRRGVPP